MSSFDCLLNACVTLYASLESSSEIDNVTRVAACVNRQMFYASRPGRCPDDKEALSCYAADARLEVQGVWNRVLECLICTASPTGSFSALLASKANTSAVFVALVFSATSMRKTSPLCWMQLQFLRILLESGAPIPRFLEVDPNTVAFDAGSAFSDALWMQGVVRECTVSLAVDKVCASRHGYNVIRTIAQEATRRRGGKCYPDPGFVFSSNYHSEEDLAKMADYAKQKRTPLFHTALLDKLRRFDVASRGWSVDSPRCVWVTACVTLGLASGDT